jgi:hypothetical protein
VRGTCSPFEPRSHERGHALAIQAERHFSQRAFTDRPIEGIEAHCLFVCCRAVGYSFGHDPCKLIASGKLRPTELFGIYPKKQAAAAGPAHARFRSALDAAASGDSPGSVSRGKAITLRNSR